MTFPFEFLNSTSRELGLVVAVLIGVAFGFVLERAGFGRADKLAAQFYLRDMRVFKVMFTGIVTAMLGLMIASGFGLTTLRDISESIVSFTWIWPMLAGGFVLGIGFIVSGYCPGTSIVASASGNVDGLFTVGGVITGTFLYSELLQIPLFHQFHNSGAKGPWFLYDLIKVPPQAIAACVTVMAILAFVGAEKVEAMIGGARTAKRVRRYAFATVSMLAVVAVVTIAIPATPAAASQPRATISAAELARMVVDAPWSVRIIDTRDAAAFAKDRVPGSQNIRAESLADLPNDGRAVVVLGEVKQLPANARLLAGGMKAWKADPLVVAMTSSAPPPPPPPAAGGMIAKPKKKGGGCSA
ncbi:MAG TPA: YeeE/YedE thiosulfate transporter family protein [Thermoanaerobaculia bacterium]|nr:YeeE/YedE thiosulfate transporter family protein [Thermoanaerobaculia bacterium]